MLAMQYTIPLPANYRIQQVRERVEARKNLFDDHAGLVHKSFLFSEADHLYAPFYLWKDISEAQRFLLEDLFKGVIDTLGRHRVRSWIVLAAQYGNRALKPAYARREIDAIAAELPLERFATEEKTAQAALLTDPNLYLHTVAFDADRWEVMRFSLWNGSRSAGKPQSDCVQEYDVLHVSEPG